MISERVVVMDFIGGLKAGLIKRGYNVSDYGYTIAIDDPPIGITIYQVEPREIRYTIDSIPGKITTNRRFYMDRGDSFNVSLALSRVVAFCDEYRRDHELSNSYFEEIQRQLGIDDLSVHCGATSFDWNELHFKDGPSVEITAPGYGVGITIDKRVAMPSEVADAAMKLHGSISMFDMKGGPMFCWTGEHNE